MKNANRNIVNPIALLFFPIILSAFLFAGKAEALVLQAGNLTAVMSLNKTTYCTGETITATVSYQYITCSNNPAYAYISWKIDNGSYGTIVAPGYCSSLCTVVQVQATTPAPQAIGSHTAGFLISFNNLKKTGAISFTVFEPSNPSSCGGGGGGSGPEQQPPPPFTVPLTVIKNGDGSGTVTSSPGGINCGSDCQENYPGATDYPVFPGTAVTLTGTADPGSYLAMISCNNIPIAFNGATSGVVTLVDLSQTCTATFVSTGSETHDLFISKIEQDGASGTVLDDPVGSTCGRSSGSFIFCHTYSAGTIVNLTPLPNPGSLFTWGWFGPGACYDNTAVMDKDRTCIAVFYPNVFDLTVFRIGPGSVTSDPPGIGFICGWDVNVCVDTASYSGGTVVTLIASPKPGYTASWSGDPDCSDGVVTMDAAKSCTVTFIVAPPPPPPPPPPVTNPSDFTLSSGSAACNSVPLSWTASSGADGYRILKGSARVDITPYQPYTALNFTDTTVNQNTTYLYQIEAYNAGGTNRSNAINVTTPYCLPGCALSGNPLSIYQGQTSTLTWGSISYATSCIASGAWSGSKSISGASEIVAPSPPSATYYLTCSGPGGSTQCLSPVTVNVSPLGLPGWKEIIPR